MLRRTFTSYGPIDVEVNYYAPREELIELVYSRLIGEDPEKNGHYITVWAPRQTGKTWIMQQVSRRLKKEGQFDAVIFSMEFVKEQKSERVVLEHFSRELSRQSGEKLPPVKGWEDLPSLFTREFFQRPLLLILDEFDSLENAFINRFASVFRGIYTSRTNEADKKSHEKHYLLHGAALIGVRSVLGIENEKGSPFNIQRSIHIPNLTDGEVASMFKWYEEESGQEIAEAVIRQLYDECGGQPGLTCWFGELLTEQFNKEKSRPIGLDEWKYAYMYASQGFPNNNILNLIEKAKRQPYRDKVLELFRTDEKMAFRFDNEHLNYLYMNGIIDMEENRDEMELHVRFSCPFVQKRLFDYFSHEIFHHMGRLLEPFENLEDAVNEEGLDIKRIIGKYQSYLDKNREWLFKDVPRRSDLRIFEAVYHFNLFRYLYDLLKEWKSGVYPEFPTGNGKIDILIKHGGQLYGLELKSFTTRKGYQDALHQAALYGRQLGLKEIVLVFFIEHIDQENRQKYEADYVEKGKEGDIVVKPIFVQTTG
jgi:hypothetical protein